MPCLMGTGYYFNWLHTEPKGTYDMERNCQNCDHAGQNRVIVSGGTRHETGGLVCRRYPPSVGTHQLFNDHKMELTSTWPSVHAEDRCGEFTPRQESATE